MKNYMFFLIAFLFMLSTVSAQVNNNLVVFCNEGEKFILILNGQKYNEIPATSVKASNLNLTAYKVKVIFENSRVKDLNTTLSFFKTGKECVFGLMKKGNRKYSMDYVSATDIDPVSNANTGNRDFSTEPNTETNTNTNTNTNTTTSPTDNPTPNPNSISIKAGGLTIGMNENGGIKLGTKEGSVNVNTRDKSGNVTIDDGANGVTLNKAAKVGCATALSIDSFESIKNSISNQTSDSTKLLTANVLLENSCFLSSQVKELVQLFSEDTSKLELAKKAYSHTHDLNNFYQVKSALGNEDNKKELQKFINDRKD